MFLRMMYRLGMILASLLPGGLFAQPDFSDLRQRMVREQIQARGITSPQVLRALRTVERHLLVPQAYRNRAYEDTPLPIGHGQTISQPFVVALMTELLRPHPDDRMLDIGTGSGYQAAVLAEIVDQVYSIEIVPELGIEARKRLAELGYENIEVRIGDGYHGWPDAAPFDGIVIAATIDTIPPALLDQLAEGGRMVAPIGTTPERADLVLLRKKKGEIIRQKLVPVRFVPFVRSTPKHK